VEFSGRRDGIFRNTDDDDHVFGSSLLAGGRGIWSLESNGEVGLG